VKSIRTVRRSCLKRTSGRCRLDIYVLLKGEHLTRSNEDRDTGKTQVKSDEALRYKRINISRLVKFSLSFPPPIHLHCHVGHAVGSVIVGRQGPPEVEQQQKRAVPEHTERIGEGRVEAPVSRQDEGWRLETALKAQRVSHQRGLHILGHRK